MASDVDEIEPPPLRVVLDTNVVLSALVFAKGSTALIRSAWQAGECIPLVSTATVQELIRVLAYPKFRLDTQEQSELLADYLPFTEVVGIHNPPPFIPDCRDPDDLAFLVLAQAGKAQALVTGDAYLLVLGRLGLCEVVTPEAFRLQLGRRSLS